MPYYAWCEEQTQIKVIWGIYCILLDGNISQKKLKNKSTVRFIEMK